MAVLDASVVELETARKIFWLLTHDYVFLGSYNQDKKDWDDGNYPAINCNDLFAPAADAEALMAEDLDAYIAACKLYGDTAAAAWCAVKRNAKLWRQPTDEAWVAKFEEAKLSVEALIKEHGGAAAGSEQAELGDA